MQQHDTSPKKRRLYLFITYTIMTLAVVTISAVCILLVLGYRLDLKKGDVEQGALLQFRSFPEGASIQLDGQSLGFNTPGKQTISADDHTVKYQLDGYETWQKSFTSHPSELLWLNYARLIPKKLETNDLMSLPFIHDMIPSPDKKWLFMQQSVENPEFMLVDVRSSKEPIATKFVLPSSSYNQQPGQPDLFELVEWDFGARFILIKHSSGSKSEFIRIDRTNQEEAVNISTKLGVSPTAIHFSGTSGNVFYALESGNLRRLDIGSGTLTQPIIKDVTQFELYKSDVIAFVRRMPETYRVGTLVDDKASLTAVYDVAVPVLIDISSYFNDNYLAVGRGHNVDVYAEPETNDRKKITTIKMPMSQEWLRFANSGRFITAGVGSQFTTYDLETKELFNTNMPGSSADTKKPLLWLDDYYLVSTANNDVRLSEFDGTNQHVIIPSLPNVAVSISSDSKFLYSVGKNQNGAYALRATKMTVR